MRTSTTKTTSVKVARKAPAKKATTKAAATKVAATKAATPAAKSRIARAPKAAAPKKAVAPKIKAEVEQKEKPKKAKLVRDSFTMPEPEYAVLGEMKKACLKAGIEVKKSELLRVGVALVRTLDIAQLKTILAGLPALKAGRPKKSK
jgi:hypothetical protein